MRLLFFLLLLPPLFLVISCTSTAKKEDTLVKEEEVWLQTYIKAKTEKNCELFAALSKEPRFVLKTLSLIRAHMVCDLPSTHGPASVTISTATAVTQLDPAPNDLGKELGPSMLYLKTLNDERVLIEAERSKDPIALSAAWRAKALASDRVREKVQFLEKALEYSKTISTTSTASTDSAGATLNEKQTEIQNRIYALAPRLKPDPLPNDFQKVGSDYAFNREFDKARDFFKKIIESKSSTFEEKYQAQKSFRNSYKVEQNRDLHILESEKMTRWLLRTNAAGSLIHESYITWARSLWTVGRPDEAKVVLQKAEKSLRKFHPLDEIEFIRGRMAEEVGDFKSAYTHYEKGQALAKKKTLSRERLVFSKAWALRKLGQFSEAASTLETLKNQTQDPFDAYRYQFWLGRSLKQAGELDKANTAFQQLRNDDTLGYYGLMAYRELNQELPPLKLDQKVWLAYLKAYAQAGLFLPLFTQLGTLDSNLKIQLLKEHPDLLFPKKYLALINFWSEKLQVKPELVLSIIRQESAFNPLARSPADAFGLMQVLPIVATEQEKITGVALAHHEDLYTPENNIPVGVALLSQLGRKYRGQFILTAAAYNASEKAIEGWLKTRLKEDPLEFIEDIPYDETRAYVKLVIRNFIFYSRLNQPQNAMAFPEWCLEDLQSFKLSTR